MRKNVVFSKTCKLRHGSQPGVRSILSRAGRRLWAGVLSHGSETERMRCSGCADPAVGPYETLLIEEAPAERRDAPSGGASEVPDRSEVKMQPQEADE
jgi:hypothetical protein